MRILYTLLFYLATPVIFLRLYWRGVKNPDYRQRWQERLGFYTQKSSQNVIWFHAVSVGEAEAVFPLVVEFKRKYPQQKILITTTTPTGSARVKAVMGNSVEHVYLPYDLPDAITRFLSHFKPQKAIIMETEIWPNLFALTSKKNIPLLIINARLSERSCHGYQKILKLTQQTLATVDVIATQTEVDSQRFQQISTQHSNIQTVGNIKFDVSISKETLNEGKALKDSCFKNRFVWIIASTHKDEEAIFLTLYSQLKHHIPELLLVIVPRHPERFNKVANDIKAKKLNFIKRSSKKVCKPETAVYLADTMGELKMLYAAADIAFVGGSCFKNLGGHNILEPMAVGIPVLFGAYMRHFKAIEQGVLATKSAIQCTNENELLAAVLSLYQNPNTRQQLIQNAYHFLKQNQGSLQKIIHLIHLIDHT
ncbi:MAG: lipid IV(A) 3-deoxy-D-manno-octulosonic acid transferase [Methylococcales bacterium]|nr:lipid IV(A) 3-deoxy-D-manno-octulosonic acid transferase [Methylococcales bacterium]